MLGPRPSSSTCLLKYYWLLKTDAAQYLGLRFGALGLLALYQRHGSYTVDGVLGVLGLHIIPPYSALSGWYKREPPRAERLEGLFWGVNPTYDYEFKSSKGIGRGSENRHASTSANESRFGPFGISQQWPASLSFSPSFPPSFPLCDSLLFLQMGGGSTGESTWPSRS